MCRCDTVDLMFINFGICSIVDGWKRYLRCYKCYFDYECYNWIDLSGVEYDKNVFWCDYQMIYSEGE